MKMREPTDFEKRVYEALCRVPRGKVTTYKALANVVGCRSARAIGGAMKRNPYAPEVPCHRVLNSKLELCGYQGQTQGEGLERKRQLLEREGVKIDSLGRLKDRSLVVEDF